MSGRSADPEAGPPFHSVGGGRYRLGAPLGSGGTAKVYRGFDMVDRVERAVKLLRGDPAMRAELRLRVQAEWRMMDGLRHPNILSVYDVGGDDQCDWVVMELAEGGSLDDRLLRHGALAPAEAVEFGLQILSGLGCAHAAGIVHRDIKPQNILLDTASTARIADFGIALYARAGVERVTEAGVVMGSFAYMSPEQRLDARRVEGTADLYSVGATLYVLLTGRTPVDLFAANESSGRWDAVPPGLAAVLRRATRFDPRERYENAREMAQALAEAGGREIDPDRFPTVPTPADQTATLSSFAEPTMPPSRYEPTIDAEVPAQPEPGEPRARFRQVVLAAFVLPVLLFGPTLLYFWVRG